ncbi:hypothetical protein PENTCL1PPCAC_15740, partial [Pristionchus entomophagus]
PTLSFCASRNTAERPLSDPAAAAAARGAPRTTDGHSKRNDSPTPRRQRWIFIPAKALEKELLIKELEKELRGTPAATRHSSQSSSSSKEHLLIIPPEPFESKRGSASRSV